MPRPERFSEVAPLPPHGEWRRVLALDRGAGAPRPVALSFLPPSVIDDPTRLAAVVRDVEAAGRLHHPGAVAVLGLETVDDVPAIVEAHVPGVTLRALLDAAGRLPADLAARIAVDVCAAAARAHVLDAGDGRPLVHGAIAPSRVVIGEDGAARLAGFGEAGGGAPADDVRALGAVLHECLAGEPAGDPPRPLDAPGVPPALAAAVASATGAAGPPPSSAAVLAQAIVAGGAVASHADVAAYADAILPAGEGARGELERALAPGGAGAEEVSAELIVDPAAFRASAPQQVRPAAEAAAPPRVRADAEPTPEPLPRPPATRPGADPAGVFAAPRPVARRSRLAAGIALVCLVAGFGAGFLAARRWADAVGAAAPTAESAAEKPAAAPSPGADAPRPEPAPHEASPVPGPVESPRAAAPAPRPTRAAKPVPHAKPPARGSRGAPAVTAARGILDVSAPAEAEVFLDGRRIGRGGLRVDVAAGAHRIEVRLGESRVGESFELAPGETWTYEVTPTP